MTALTPGLRARWDILERFRPDIIADLAMTWWQGDLTEAVDHYIAVARSPSLTKDALSAGLLEGELMKDGGGLKGTLALTDEGRLLVRRMLWKLRSGGLPQETAKECI